MSEPDGPGGEGASAKDDVAIPAAVVERLIESNEEEIERLRHQLAEALAEAEEAEGRVEAHPGAPLLPLDWKDLDELAPSGQSSEPTLPPRTTVVTRRS
jgi:hypothetical protein